MNPLATPLLLLGASLTLISLIVVHLLPTKLDPLRDPVSRYGITAFRGWYWSAAAGAALAGVGGALFFSAIPGVIAIVTTVLLSVFAVARALIGLFPMDAPDAAKSRTGRIHNLLAFAAFASVTAAAFTGAGALHDAGAVALSPWSTALGAIMAAGTIGVILTTASSALRGLFGLTERLIYVGFIAWFLMLGLAPIS
ncbi:MAG: DUF998 domain-containing protein [Microbacterium sp.]